MPYAPGNWGVYSQGLANFASGVSEGTSGVAAGLKEWQDKKQLTKSLRTMFSVVDPENKDRYETMGLPELQGQLKSYSMQYTVNQLKQQQQELKQEEAIGEALRRYGEGPTPPADTSADYGGEMGPPQPLPSGGSVKFGLTSIPTPMGMPAPMVLPTGYSPDTGSQLQSYAPTQEDRIRYALQTPGLGGTGAVKLLNALNSYQAMRGGDVKLPLGATMSVPGVGDLVGTGSGNQLVLSPRSTAKPGLLGVGEVRSAGELGNIVGTGENNQFVASPNAKGSITEVQSNALTFADRMKMNNDTIEALMAGTFDPTAAKQIVNSRLPNIMKSDARQSYDAAKNNWISAALRKESGAAISQAEYVNADKEYFPQPGDSAQVVKQKRALRLLAEADIRKAAGPAANAPAASATAAVQPQALRKFDSEDAARAAGIQPNEVFLIYDPATATYRRARIK